MEDTLRVQCKDCSKGEIKVLILVLMEDTLRVKKEDTATLELLSLNPCFNGRYSQRIRQTLSKEGYKSLNPCFNGRYSQSQGKRCEP